MDFQVILKCVLVVVAFKAVFIGSEFSFYWLSKHGKKYWNWYNNRESYSQFLKRNS